jgi:hypothetical protein
MNHSSWTLRHLPPPLLLPLLLTSSLLQLLMPVGNHIHLQPSPPLLAVLNPLTACLKSVLQLRN